MVRLLSALLLGALVSCGQDEPDLDADESSGSEGDGLEGPAYIYPNGHPLDWRTADTHTLFMEDEVLRLVNKRRTSLGLAPLTMQASHRRAARGHSRHMRIDVHNFFSHECPEGLTPGERLRANGVEWTSATENIASGQLSPQEVFSDWVSSPGHLKHIDDPHVRRTGVGFQLGGGGGDWPTYWTQVFTD